MIYITQASVQFSWISVCECKCDWNVNRQDVLFYILDTIVFFFLFGQQKELQTKSEQNICASQSNTAVFCSWMNRSLIKRQF